MGRDQQLSPIEAVDRVSGGEGQGDDRQEGDEADEAEGVCGIGTFVELPPDGGGLHLHPDRASDGPGEEQAEVPQAEDRRHRVHGSNLVGYLSGV